MAREGTGWAGLAQGSGALYDLTMHAFPLEQPAIAIVGAPERFPVSRVFCVGRNYAAHAREMGGDPDRQAPFFFMKPASAVTEAAALPFPQDTDDLHHEVELVVAIGPGKAIYGYAVGVDLTKRDRQNEAKDKAQPWERAKAFPRAAPISAIRRAGEVSNVERARIALSVNGVGRQDSTIAHMIWSVPEILARLDALWELSAGDLVFTGTPEGVAKLVRGDRVNAEIAGVAAHDFTLS
jgi:fumarylpyruvate hydrolase